MNLPTNQHPIRTLSVRVPVPVFVIPGTEISATNGECILSDAVAGVLSPLTREPGFIGFKTPITPELGMVLNGSHSGLFYDYVTPDGVAEVGFFGWLKGPLTNWDRWVYVVDEEFGSLQRVVQVPFGAEVWACWVITKDTCFSVLPSFYTPDPGEQEL